MSHNKEKSSRHALIPVSIPVHDAVLEGELSIPENAKALVVVLDEERHKAGCRDIAHVLNTHDFATLVVTLVTRAERENGTAHAVSRDIPRLSQRLQDVTAWARNAPETRRFMIGYMAFSEDAAPALIDVARHQDIVGAVVACAGRTDLAERFLPFVRRPLLLVACGHDPDNLAVNREALEKINSTCELHVLPDADSVFATVRALNETAQKAASWFDAYLH